jgi:hypothetical protein
LEEGKEMLARALQTSRRQPSVSLVIDAGTIHRRRFLDLVLLSAASTIRPFLYDAAQREKFGVSDYDEIVAKAILYRKFTLRNDPTPGTWNCQQMSDFWEICTCLCMIGHTNFLSEQPERIVTITRIGRIEKSRNVEKVRKVESG